MTTPQSVRLIIVGTGGMANTHVHAYQKIPGVEIVAGVDVRAEQRTVFNEKYGIPNGFSSVEEAIKWGQFDAVSNVTPDRFHFETTMPFLAARKHVMCEKPLATNAADAVKMAEAAAKAGVVNAVNFTYRNGQAMQRAAQMVRDGAIGEVRFFEASYMQSWLHESRWWGDWKTKQDMLWRLSSAHGSKGALGDIGVHILDYALYVANQPVTTVSGQLATYEKAPPENKIGDYILDANDSATMLLTLANGAVGTLTATRVATGHHNDLRLRIYGTEGGLEVFFENETSWLSACIGADRQGPAQWHTLDCPPVTTNYERFVAAVRGDVTPLPADFARGAEIQKILDATEVSAGQESRVVHV